MTLAELNSIKEKFSIAYLHAVTAKLNYGIDPCGKDYDLSYGKDYRIMNRSVGLGRRVASESNEITVQLKGVSSNSSSMFSENNKEVKFNTGSGIVKFGYCDFYLVIVQLPADDDLENWLEVDSEKLILKKCAYYYKVDDTTKAGFITIPKINIFTHITLPLLFTTKFI